MSAYILLFGAEGVLHIYVLFTGYKLLFCASSFFFIVMGRLVVLDPRIVSLKKNYKWFNANNADVGNV